MRSSYSFIFDNLLISLDTVELDDVAHIHYISRLLVPESLRNQGIGSAALRCLCRDADQFNKTLLVGPSPYSNDKADYDRLVHFYQRFGFQGRLDGMLARKPNSVELPEIF